MNTFIRMLLWTIARCPAWLDRRLPMFLGRGFWLRARNVALERFPRPFTRTIQPEGVTFSGTTRDVIQRSIMLHGVWEPDISHWMRGFVSYGDVVVDIGANTGYYSLILSRLVGPQGRIIAVEPVPSIHTELVQRLKVNGIRNVEVRNVAFGAGAGTTEVFRASEENVGNSSTVAEEGHVSEGQVAVMAADDALLPTSGAIKLVKIDTEGDELRILEGMRNTLAGMPSGSGVLVEVTPEKLAMRGHRPDVIWSLFRSLGWDAFRIRNDYDFSRYSSNQGAELEEVRHLPDERCDLIFLKR